MRRRTFFGIVGASAVSAAILPIGSVAARGRVEPTRSRVPSLDFLLAPLVGRSLPGGFRVSSAADVDRGAAQITLTHQDGSRVVVQAFRRSVLSSGLATTRLLDLRWMNGADGGATHEGAGIAVMNLAARIRRIEASTLRDGLSASQRAAVASLYTHERRNAIHGGFRTAADPVASAEPA